jgi:hypothetical protein
MTTPRRIETSLVVAEGFTDREGNRWERGDGAPLARRAVREAAMEHPGWFVIEYETVPLTSREEWLAEIDARYQQEYERVKAHRDGAEERRQAALRAEFEEQEHGQSFRERKRLERRLREQEKEREEQAKARREDHERRVIENELEHGALAGGFHYDR